MPAPQLSAEHIRSRRAEAPNPRDRDFAEALGISEAALVAAYCGQGVTRIAADPDVVMAAAQELGEVMALTRNTSCVHEKIGTYDNYHPGKHAAMILTDDIDLRIFPTTGNTHFWLSVTAKQGQGAAYRFLMPPGMQCTKSS
ncbi:MAG: ChuX/HutX family heme-like substrate-binding protein [Tateyamaria sp.]